MRSKTEDKNVKLLKRLISLVLRNYKKLSHHWNNNDTLDKL